MEKLLLTQKPLLLNQALKVDSPKPFDIEFQGVKTDTKEQQCEVIGDAILSVQPQDIFGVECHVNYHVESKKENIEQVDKTGE